MKLNEHAAIPPPAAWRLAVLEKFDLKWMIIGICLAFVA